MEQNNLPAPAYVYTMRCANGALYTGWTNDLLRRLRAHASGKGAKYTPGFGGEERWPMPSCWRIKPPRCAGKQPSKSAARRKRRRLPPGSIRPALCCCGRLARRTPRRCGYLQPLCAALYRILFVPTAQTGGLPAGDAYPLPSPALLSAENALGQALGYACAHPCATAQALTRGTPRPLFYLAPEARRLGVGSMLYHALLAALCRQGYWNAYAVLADPNPASEAFHERFGFVCEGRRPAAG